MYASLPEWVAFFNFIAPPPLVLGTIYLLAQAAGASLGATLPALLAA